MWTTIDVFNDDLGLIKARVVVAFYYYHICAGKIHNIRDFSLEFENWTFHQQVCGSQQVEFFRSRGMVLDIKQLAGKAVPCPYLFPDGFGVKFVMRQIPCGNCRRFSRF